MMKCFWNLWLRYDSGNDFSWFSGQWSQKEAVWWSAVILYSSWRLVWVVSGSERYSEPGRNRATTAIINVDMCHNPAMVPVVISPNRLTSLGYVIGANIPKPADTMNKTLIDDSLTHDCLAYPDLVYIPHVKHMICDIIPSYKRSFKHRRKCQCI